MIEKIEKFVEENEISEKGKREILEILNESLLEISMEIMSTKRVNSKEKLQRYKSKKAEEYALEHGIEMREFEKMEISKKDVEEKVREKVKSEVKSEVKGEVKGEVKEKVKRERVICSGINKKGECCKSVGTMQPEGAKRKYCLKHVEDYRSFECQSDSSDEEELIEEKLE
tara:strand:+ start:244 stop:756 length:513 start_codon:yes stop_codon:yes gene_type:complete